MTQMISKDEIRTHFSEAMSDMYRTEVPLYGALIDMVNAINADAVKQPDAKMPGKMQFDGMDRVSIERHGAIRVGLPHELSLLRRIFAIMGMEPVGYYDLSVAAIPVHSTAFRPVDDAALRKNPFRIFTSLLRLDLIKDEALRDQARAVLEARSIASDAMKDLVEKAEADGGLMAEDLEAFVSEAVSIFRWREEANVSADLYEKLHAAHRLIADIVSFKGPHINHLTPRTLDIDAAQTAMPANDIAPKAVVEGPPLRKCPILLRQTSFKALSETVSFPEGDGQFQAGKHTARFGEIEQRGAALTPKGRALYDRLLLEVRAKTSPAADGSNASAYMAVLEEVFAQFPDDWDEMRKQGLIFCRYFVEDGAELPASLEDLEGLVDTGAVRFEPLTYEDFLPVSAAGIFQSNLGDDDSQTIEESPEKALFERELGASVIDEFGLYAAQEQASLDAIGKRIGTAAE